MVTIEMQCVLVRVLNMHMLQAYGTCTRRRPQAQDSLRTVGAAGSRLTVGRRFNTQTTETEAIALVIPSQAKSESEEGCKVFQQHVTEAILPRARILVVLHYRYSCSHRRKKVRERGIYRNGGLATARRCTGAVTAALVNCARHGV